MITVTGNVQELGESAVVLTSVTWCILIFDYGRRFVLWCEVQKEEDVLASYPFCKWYKKSTCDVFLYWIFKI